MNFEGKTIINEGSRVIGLNDSDLEKLSIVKEEVKPDVQEVLAAQVMPENNASTETQATPVMPTASEVTNEAVVSDVVDAIKNEETTNIFDQAPAEVVMPTEQVTQTVTSVEPQVSVEPVKEEQNIFDMPVTPEPVLETIAKPEVIVPNVEIPAINVENNINSELHETETNEVVNEPINEPVLETPAQFYQTESVEEAPTEKVEEHQETEIQVDPVNKYLDEIRKVIDSKNEIIKALKEKNELLLTENAKIITQINELKNQIAIANQRTAIAENQRAQQVAGLQQNEFNQIVTPSQAA